MELISIASGSSGNCIYIGTDHSHILIDAGISGKRVEAGLNEHGLTMRDIDALCVTHEHTDHTSGIGVLARRYGVPIYTTEGTWRGMMETKSLGQIDPGLYHPIVGDIDFTIGDMTITPVPVSHDAYEPVAYLATDGQHKVGVMTDLGYYTEAIKTALTGMDILLLEANHDIRMLETGPYPYYLKQRILGDRGHLSNEASGQLLSDILHDDFKTVILGHLSKENNIPELAYETVKSEITMGDTPYHGGDFPIYVAERDRVSQRFTV